MGVTRDDYERLLRADWALAEARKQLRALGEPEATTSVNTASESISGRLIRALELHG
jgi:hypothetical protein